jgi:nicotinamidase-related amidase
MNSQQTALLVMDLQEGVVERFGDQSILDRLKVAVGAARTAGIPVIYVVVGFRPGYPEISPHNKTFAALPGSDRADRLVDPVIHESVAPEAGDVVVTKRRVSAFAGSDLDMVLRARGISSLVLTGIATSGVVLSTLGQAADLDYELTVLADGCADGDEEVQRVLTEKVFPRQATVTTVEEWAGSF